MTPSATRHSDASATCWSKGLSHARTARDRARSSSGKRAASKLLGEILVDLEYCTEDQVVECLAAEYGVPYAKLDARLFDPKIVDVLPREYIEKNLVLPLFVVREVLTIAVSEPSNLFLIDEIRGADRPAGADRRRHAPKTSGG